MSEQPLPITTLPVSSERWPRIVRIACLVAVVLVIGLFAASYPSYYVQLHFPCAAAVCENDQLTSQQIQMLQASGVSIEVYIVWRMATTIMLALVCFAVAGVLLWRRSTEGMALLVAVMLVLIGATFGSPIQTLALVYPLVMWVLIALNILTPICIYLFFYLFPDGRFVPRWTRWLTVGFIVLAIRALIDVPDLVYLASILVYALSGVYAQVYRYRHVSSALQRQQTKWIIFGFAAAMTGLIGVGAIFIFLPELYQSGVPTFFLLDAVLYGAIALIPLSIGFAMLRYHLYDIDLLINRALVYGALTTTLASIYIGSVVLLQVLFRRFTGQNSQVGIVASTLAIAALFNPLRRRIQSTIDRLFYRRKYDATHILAAFSRRLRDETDLDRLTRDLQAVVVETFQPAHSGLWLRDRAATTED